MPLVRIQYCPYICGKEEIVNAQGKTRCISLNGKQYVDDAWVRFCEHSPSGAQEILQMQLRQLILALSSWNSRLINKLNLQQQLIN